MQAKIYEKFLEKHESTAGLINLDKEDIDWIHKIPGESVQVEGKHQDSGTAMQNAFAEANKKCNVNHAKGALIFVTGGAKFVFDDLDISATIVHDTLNKKAEIVIQAIVEDKDTEFFHVEMVLVGL